jgi:AcrR family transcriptional regulator
MAMEPRSSTGQSSSAGSSSDGVDEAWPPGRAEHAAATGEPDAGHNDRWMERRNEIVDVAAELFATNGYASTGLTDLCTAVGLGRGSLYHYIGSKEHLLALVHDRVMVQMQRFLDEIMGLDVSPGERLRLLAIEHVRLTVSYPHHSWVGLHEWRALTGTDRERFFRIRQTFEDVVTSILEAGIKEREFQIPDVGLAVFAWFGTYNYIIQWYRSEGRLNYRQIANGFHEMFIRGIQRPAE